MNIRLAYPPLISRYSSRFFSTSLVALSLWGMPVLAAEFPITKDGVALVEVQNADQNSQVLTYATEEFVRAVRIASGASLEQKAFSGQEESTPRVVIGSLSALPKEVRQSLKLQTQSEDEVLIRAYGQTLYIVGPTERAALYAVYTFLDEVAGVRWLWPGETGERIPKTPSLTMPDAVISQAPGIKYRSLAISGKHYDDDVQTWMARNRLNIDNIQPGFTKEYLSNSKKKGFQVRFAGHSVTLPKQILEAHPEYVALTGGLRKSVSSHGAHLCWSNPGVQKELIKTISERIQSNPEVDIMALYTADQWQYCECDACIAMAKDVSTRWQRLSAILLKELRQEHPKVKFWTLAYALYRPVPSFVADYDHIGYALSNASYRHLLGSGNPTSKEALSQIEKWREKGGRMGLRTYEMIPVNDPRVFIPLVTYIADEMAYAKAHQLTSYSGEILCYGWREAEAPELQNWNVNRMNVYTAARAMWNPDITAKSLIEEWCGYAYGPAAAAMAEYYHRLENAWRKAPGDIMHYQQSSAIIVDGFMSRSLITQTEASLATAREALNNADPSEELLRQKQAIALDEKMFRSWKMLFDYSLRTPSRFMNYVQRVESGSGEEAKRAVDLPWSSAHALPPLHDEEGKEAAAATWVKTFWDAKNLYIRLECVDGSETDSLELFINNPMAEGVHRLVLYRDGNRQHELQAVGHEPDKSAIFDWDSQPLSAPDRDVAWGADITIPLASLGMKAVDGAEISFALQRSFGEKDAASTVAGWPGGVYNLTNYGTLKLLSRVPPKVAIYDCKGESDPMYTTLKAAGWDIERAKNSVTSSAISLEGKDIAIIYHGDGKGFSLPAALYRNELTQFMENGGLVIVSATVGLPLHKWFNNADLELKWNGTEALRRNSEKVYEGAWLKTPHDLSKFLHRGNTPLYGFTLVGTGWRPLAEIILKNGETAPFFLMHPYGKGALIVTTSALGNGGRYEMFGDRYISRMQLLLENFFVNRESLSQ